MIIIIQYNCVCTIKISIALLHPLKLKFGESVLDKSDRFTRVLFRLHDRVVGRGPPVLQITDKQSDGMRHLHNRKTRADGSRVLRLLRRAVQHGWFNRGEWDWRF